MKAGAEKTYYAKRVNTLKKKLGELGIDSFVTFNLKNVRYLTGFSGTSGAVAITDSKAIFFTDFRYASQVKKQVTSMKIEIGPSLNVGIADLLTKEKIGSTGYEGDHISVSSLSALKKEVNSKRKTKSALRWKSTHPIEEMRIIKDKLEIGLIEKNMQILSKVFDKAGEVLSPGIRESDAAAQLELQLRLSGGEGKAFDFIIASGTRSALPHGVAGKKKIGKNDFVTLDWGCLLEGYHTDNTRNFSFGRPKQKIIELHRIVLEANRTAIEAVAPDVRLSDIDRAARSVIEKQRYGKFFGHGTGHGVGLDIHEAPTVSPRSKSVAKEGMVFTIEPGIYLPGIGGVRIEDMVLVTKTGCRLISRNIPQELVKL